MVDLEQLPQILARTERWIVLNKPAGWLTIPGRLGPEVPVLLPWVEGVVGSKVWVVHRLDRETSGVVLLALTADAHRLANDWFSDHQVKKTYEFLAAGRMKTPVIRINEPVGGLASVTQVEVRKKWDHCFLGWARPLSGRRHQIRVHLAERGHPLLGDVLYRGPASVPRVALHAARLELPSGEAFEAPRPLDFTAWVEKLDQKGSL